MDATDGVTDIRIGEYAPEERSPANRVYLIPGVQKCDDAISSTGLINEVDMLVRAKRAFVKALDDNDVLAISNIDAIESMMIAQQKRKNQKIEDYNSMRGTAVGLMAEQTNHTEQRSKRPFISFTKTAGFNYARIR